MHRKENYELALFPTFPLGSDKARSGRARFLIAPVENRTCPFEGIRLHTFD
jgi:hypothetical protein